MPVLLFAVVVMALKYAAGFIGTREEPLGSNRGPLVTKFLNSIGLDGGYPWCAAFVYYCVWLACLHLKLKVNFKQTGACVLFEKWARDNKCLYNEPQCGDVFLSYSTPHGENRSRASHTGFVESVDYAKRQFTTIEGNTNLDGGREGIGVFRRVRKFSDRYKFIRWNQVQKGDLEKGAAVPPAAVAVAKGAVYSVYLNDTKFYDAQTFNGRTYLPIDLWCRKIGVSWEFDVPTQLVKIQGREASLDYRVEVLPGGQNVPLAPIRQLVKFSALVMETDLIKREIRISRPAPKAK